MAKQLAKKQQQELTVIDFSGDMGAGMEAADSDSFAIPFLTLIQKMSPQVDEAEATYIPDAKPGMLLNTVSQELFDGKEGVAFLPCAYQRKFIKWGPRGTSEAGFKGELSPEEVAIKRDSGEIKELEGRLYIPLDDGTIDEKRCIQLKDTRNHFGIILTPEPQQILLSLSSTQIKKSKQMMSMLNQVKVDTPQGKMTPPTWLNQLRLTTISESNDKGSWHSVKISREGFVNDPDIYALCKDFHATISAGEVNVKYDDADDDRF